MTEPYTDEAARVMKVSTENFILCCVVVVFFLIS